MESCTNGVCRCLLSELHHHNSLFPYLSSQHRLLYSPISMNSCLLPSFSSPRFMNPCSFSSLSSMNLCLLYSFSSPTSMNSCSFPSFSSLTSMNHCTFMNPCSFSFDINPADCLHPSLHSHF